MGRTSGGVRALKSLEKSDVGEEMVGRVGLLAPWHLREAGQGVGGMRLDQEGLFLSALQGPEQEVPSSPMRRGGRRS